MAEQDAGKKYKLCTERIDSVSMYLDFIEREMSAREKDLKEGRGPPAFVYPEEQIRNFLFRGQPVDEPLLPKLARVQWDAGLLDSEKHLIEEFARLSPPFTKAGFDDKWDRIALAQHHGLPTRLLDWTTSAMAALWFAVGAKPEKDKDGKERDGVVWILRPLAEDFVVFPAVESPSDLARTRVFRPRVVSDRIAAQSGVFTVHANFSPPDRHFLPLEENHLFGAKLTKVPILAENFRSLRRQLHACGVNSSTIYPDLGGLCQHLQWRYSRDEK